MNPAAFARLASALVLAALLTACGGSEDVSQEAIPPVDDVYRQAEALSADGEPSEAAKQFEEVERLYPYAQLAKPAMLRAAQSYYQARDYDQARLAAERYLSFYPSDPQAAQAQYIKAMSYYDQIADSQRDQGNTREAMTALRETIQRYPDTEYAREARLKLDLTLDHLAGKEMAIGRFYLKNQHYISAINRFRTVVEQYQTTSHTPEALHRLVEAYMSLGVTDEAQTAAAVLGHNFPGSSWYAHSYDLLTGSNLAPKENSDSWISRAYRQVIKGEWL